MLYATIQTSFLPFPLIVPSFHTPFLPRSLIPLTSLKKFTLTLLLQMHPLQTYSQGRHFLHNIGANSSTTDILALDKGMVGKDFPPLVITASFLTFKSFFSLPFYSSDLTRERDIYSPSWQFRLSNAVRQLACSSV